MTTTNNRTRSLLILLSLCMVGPAPVIADDSDDKLLKKADEIAVKVVKLRGLKQKRRIKRGVMTKQQIRERLVTRVDQEYSPDEIAAEELALKRLGMLPPDANYKQLVIDILTDQIAGFYDPIEQHLYIAGWDQGGLGGVFDDMLMAHEIDHALQDQHFDLRKFMKLNKSNSDATVARQALVEGDGTALMIEYMMSSMGNGSPWSDSSVVDMMGPQMSASMSSQLSNAPLVLREGLVFPYLGGLGFVAHFRKTHPWKRIDQAYRKPPLSTEHILHPDKFVAYERPDEITVRSIPALAGYQARYNNVNGEFGLSLLLREHTTRPMKQRGDINAPKDKAERAAAGWGGDRLAIYAPTNHDGKLAGTVGVSYSVWDETADAIEFFEMLSDAMASLSGGKVVKDGEAYVEYAAPSGDAFIAQRKDDAVVLIIGAPAAKAQAIVGQVWKSWRVRRR